MSTEPVRSATQPLSPHLAAQVNRRELLLKGLGKGTTIVAAVAPIQSLAFTSAVTANGKICSCSGVQSAAHSRSTGLPTCGGRSPDFYNTVEHWPNYNPTTKHAPNTVGTITFDETTKFKSIFGGGQSKTMIAIMQTDPLSAEFHWISALLSAVKPPSGYVFPYSPIEVLALYAGPQSAAALDFFKGYMETV
jgi:hypothetical protein